MDFGSPRLGGLRPMAQEPYSSPYPGGSTDNGGYGLGHSAHSSSPRGEPPEVLRRAAEWERQIESLDQKEMEIHQTQLRLIREQTTTFRGDLMVLQQELVDLKAVVLKHASMHTDLSSKVDGRMGSTERGLQELLDNVSKHAQLHQEGDRKLAQLNSAVSDHHRTLTNHATMKERVDYLERLVGDSADKHQRLIEDAHSKLDQLHGRLSTCETGHNDLKRAGSDKDVKHAALGDRVGYIEKLLGDSMDKHVRELDAIKKAHEKHTSDTHSRSSALEQAHASVQTRLNFLEKTVGDSADKHAKDMEAMKNSVSKITGGLQAHATVGERIAFLEKSFGDSAEKHMNEIQSAHSKIDKLGAHGDALNNLKNAHANLAQELSTYSQHHASTNDRLTYVEQVVGDSIEKHNKEIETVKAAHNKLATESRTHAQNHGAVSDKVEQHARAHATLEQRMAYIEKTVGDSVDQHSRELAALRQAHGQHASVAKEQHTRHATLEERVNFIEQVVGDSADKHTAHAQRLDHLTGKLAETQKEAQRHGGDLSAAAQRHATLEDRMGYLEKVIGDSVEQHKWEFDQIKNAHAKLTQDGKGVQAKHSTLEDRMNYIESWFKGFKAPI